MRVVHAERAGRRIRRGIDVGRARSSDACPARRARSDRPRRRSRRSRARRPRRATTSDARRGSPAPARVKYATSGMRERRGPVGLHHLDARARPERREAVQLERDHARQAEREALDRACAVLGAERRERAAVRARDAPRLPRPGARRRPPLVRARSGSARVSTAETSTMASATAKRTRERADRCHGRLSNGCASDAAMPARRANTSLAGVTQHAGAVRKRPARAAHAAAEDVPR